MEPEARAVLSNQEIADALERVADLLAAQGANPHRVRAYREGAIILRGLPRRVADVLAAEGREGLERLPGIGRSLSGAIAELSGHGRLGLLDRLEGQVAPEALFTTITGVGPELAARLHGELGAETLEELEVAAHDGRLAALPGIGPRRLRGLKDALAALLGGAARRRVARWGAQGEPAEAPAVETLLAVDEDYRRRAAAGELRRIAPRRFNPAREAWLPILHAERDGWTFTALFSNTALAHRLGRTRDWVILYWERDGREGRATVVTATHGPLAGRRIVRGREAECPGANQERIDCGSSRGQRPRRAEVRAGAGVGTPTAPPAGRGGTPRGIG